MSLEDIQEAIEKLPSVKDSYVFPIPARTGAISEKTDLRNKFPGKEVEIIGIEAKWSAAPTTAENFTVTLNRKGDTTAADVVIYSIDPSLTSITSLLYMYPEPYPLQAGDEVTIAYTNTDVRTIAGRLIVRSR